MQFGYVCRTIPDNPGPSRQIIVTHFSHISDTPRIAIRIRLPNHFRTIADHPTESDTIQSIQAFPSTHTRARPVHLFGGFESVLWVFCYMNRLTITHARHDLDIVKTGTFHANRQILPGDIVYYCHHHRNLGYISIIGRKVMICMAPLAQWRHVRLCLCWTISN